MSRILILEDDLVLLETLQDELTDYGFSIDVAKHGEEALKLIYENSYDLYIFDINVPYVSGLILLEELRESSDTTPTILLTSKKNISDKIQGFESGCDDYITKPFSMVELKHRISAILKRTKIQDFIEHDNIQIDLKNNILKVGQKKLTVDKKIVQILHLFITNPNSIFSYDDIIDKLYKEKIPTLTVIRVHISKINSLFNKKIINNIRGVGYKYDKA